VEAKRDAARGKQRKVVDWEADAGGMKGVTKVM